MEALLSFWNRLAVLGIQHIESEATRRKARLLNLTVRVALVLYVLYVPLIFIFGWHPILPVHTAGIGVLSLTLFLSNSEQFHVARWFFAIGMTLVLFWGGLQLPSSVGINYFQLLCAVLPLLLFEKPAHCLGLFVASLSAFLFVEYYHSVATPWTNFEAPLLTQLNRVSLFVALFLVLYHFRTAGDSYISTLHQSKQALEKRNKDLEVMTRAVSHDLKTPIRNISHLASWIEEDSGEGLGADTRDRLTNIQQRTERMEHLINDLLEYSNIGSSKRTLEPIDMDAELRDMVAAYAAGTMLRITVDDKMPLIRSSRVAMYQVFHNLLDNAIRHHHRDMGHIRVGYHQADGEHRFTIADDGPGIDPQFHSKIFDVFQTLDSTEQRPASGNGIGLSIVKRNVEEIGGRIWLESIPGVGTTFTVAIPVA